MDEWRLRSILNIYSQAQSKQQRRKLGKSHSRSDGVQTQSIDTKGVGEEENMFDMIRKRTQQYLHFHLMPQENKKRCEYTKVSQHERGWAVNPPILGEVGDFGAEALCVVECGAEISIRRLIDGIGGRLTNQICRRMGYMSDNGDHVSFPPNASQISSKSLLQATQALVKHSKVNDASKQQTNMWRSRWLCVYVFGKGLRQFYRLEARII